MLRDHEYMDDYDFYVSKTLYLSSLESDGQWRIQDAKSIEDSEGVGCGNLQAKLLAHKMLRDNELIHDHGFCFVGSDGYVKMTETDKVSDMCSKVERQWGAFLQSL
ncbi:hypothetical protein GmHk_10G027882 [Glycine max]|nr:hypothetical protein GmHk_10G027882 [Glycine max]